MIKNSRYNFLFILSLWIVCTALNINKAFHIDDTFHLEAAKWVAEHPFEPMSGMVNWTDVPEPVYHFNQPPAFFYVVALSGELFGYTEIPLHLVQSLFTLLALIFFFRISRIVSPENAYFLTLLFAFCPAFLVNQNLMTDVPLVSLSLVSVYLMLKPAKGYGTGAYALSVFVLGLAILTKYTLLPLLILPVISILWKRQYMNLLVLLIPLAMIGIWSWWNLWEFGNVHILGRERDTFELLDILGTTLSFLACLGAVAPFALPMFSGLFRHRRLLTLIVTGIFCLFLLFLVISWFDLITPDLSKEIIRYLFLLNGLLLASAIIYLSRRKTGHTGIILLFWFLGIAAFVIRYSPFIASRHILLAIPPGLLICSSVLNRIPPLLKIQAMTATILLGVLLGISDWLMADFYRKGAANIDLVRTGPERIWTAGHWGWQWYSSNQGMLQYSVGSQQPSPGDWLVMPSDIAVQGIDTSLKMIPERKIWKEPGTLNFLSTGYYASFYMSTYIHPAWRLSKQPIDTITIFRIIQK